MKLNFDYKIFDLENYLTKDEFLDLKNKVNKFDVNLDEIKSTLGFLSWSEKVQNKLNKIDPNRFETIIKNDYITYNDFKILNDLNNEEGFYDEDYFNFFLTYSNSTFKEAGIYEHLKKVYFGIITELFNKKVKKEYEDTFIGNINIYPKGSFIRKHQDNDPNGQRLFTILFFLNSDRTLDQGSILKLYTKDGLIDFISNFKKCVIIEHQNYNYTHEVTHNLVDDVRYSVYSPFTIKDYNEKLEDV
jgi:Rps23 Pro-64 3,4-dihydroxylase Tpa1-like proline 4-hydroxylase